MWESVAIALAETVVACTRSDRRCLQNDRFRLSDGLGGDDFLPCVTSGVKEGLHRRFAKAPPPLMSSCYIVAFDPAIEIALQLAQICPSDQRANSGQARHRPRG